jgi:hypothetical protein
MTKKLIGLAAVAATLLATSGCVLHVGGGDYGSDHRGSVEKRESHNRAAISRLELGTGFEAVRNQLGEPDFTEAFMAGQTEVRVLRYRTHRVHADGDTTPDETTPLVFSAGVLSGIGEAAVMNARAP